VKTSIHHAGTTLVKATCAGVFTAFVFCYLYFYQAEELTYLQQTLSGGQTHYDRTIGAIIITIVLLLLQRMVYGITHLRKYAHALTYFPSSLALVALTDVTPAGRLSFTWLWVAPLLLLVFAAWVWMEKQLEIFSKTPRNESLFSRPMWTNMALLIAQMLLVVLCCNNNDVFHRRLKMEQLLVKGRYAEALQAGGHSHETDSALTMLRAYALSRMGQMGDKLFEYPIVGGSEMLVPNADSARTLTMNWKIVKAFSHKGGRKDYRLMASLLDRNLDDFVYHLTIDCKTDSATMPRHYREALVLYAHKQHKIAYHDSVLDADYEDFRKLEKQQTDPVRRVAVMERAYGNTYWWYYFNQ